MSLHLLDQFNRPQVRSDATFIFQPMTHGNHQNYQYRYLYYMDTKEEGQDYRGDIRRWIRWRCTQKKRQREWALDFDGSNESAIATREAGGDFAARGMIWEDVWGVVHTGAVIVWSLDMFRGRLSVGFSITGVLAIFFPGSAPIYYRCFIIIILFSLPISGLAMAADVFDMFDSQMVISGRGEGQEGVMGPVVSVWY